MQKSVAFRTVLLLLLILPSSAQFIKWGANKTVRLDIPRPPQFGLTVKRVAFGHPGGSCASDAAQLIDQMILPDFQQNQMDVIERAALDQIMAEHNFNQSSYADGGSAVKLGKILGPSALVIVNVNGCRPDQTPLFDDQKNYNGSVTRTFISKTRFSLEGSVRVVDLTTGQVLGSHNFTSKPDKQNTSDSGPPEFPPIDEVKDSAMQDVKAQIHAMFFPFDEIVTLTFYDDKDCGLKQEYELFRNGDLNGALRWADSNLEQCKSGHKKDKSLARAYYDAALIHCALQDYEKSKELFAGATENKGAEAAANASVNCDRYREGTTALAAYKVRFAQIPAPTPILAVAGPGPRTNPDVADTPPAAKPATAGTERPQAAPASAEERLKKLDSLYKRGLINKKEYDQKRAEILNEI
jgi:hypothetical protein